MDVYQQPSAIRMGPLARWTRGGTVWGACWGACRLSERVDVLVENFRPGVMEKWGLGPADLKPDLGRHGVAAPGLHGVAAPGLLGVAVPGLLGVAAPGLPWACAAWRGL